MRPTPLKGAKKRVLQVVALYAPGGLSLRPWLHRRRGVTIGAGAWIGTDALIETSKPELVFIGRGASIGIRASIIAHFNESPDPGHRYSVRIEDEAFIGPGAIILPHVTVGRGAVVTAGSVVTRSVPPLTVVQGNPAKPVARTRVPLTDDLPIRDFFRQLEPLRR
jgi:acetyltransferase-like isoleucine patch superfamily enzyme